VRREASGVSFLMCPFCVRVLVSSSTTRKYTGRAESALASRPNSDHELRCRCIPALVCRRAGHSSLSELEATSRLRLARDRHRPVHVVGRRHLEGHARGLRLPWHTNRLRVRSAQCWRCQVEVETWDVELPGPGLSPNASTDRASGDRPSPDRPGEHTCAARDREFLRLVLWQLVQAHALCYLGECEGDLSLSCDAEPAGGWERPGEISGAGRRPHPERPGVGQGDRPEPSDGYGAGACAALGRGR
jgi:hypothetical protein